jgi:hypothetical protein
VRGDEDESGNRSFDDTTANQRSKAVSVVLLAFSFYLLAHNHKFFQSAGIRFRWLKRNVVMMDVTFVIHISLIQSLSNFSQAGFYQQP